MIDWIKTIFIAPCCFYEPMKPQYRNIANKDVWNKAEVFDGFALRTVYNLKNYWEPKSAFDRLYPLILTLLKLE